MTIFFDPGSNEAIHFRTTFTLHQPSQFAKLDVVDFPILRHWYAAYPAGRRLWVIARAFLDYLLGRGDAAPTVAGKGK